MREWTKINDSGRQVIPDTDNTITKKEDLAWALAYILVNLYLWPLVWVLELSLKKNIKL